MPRYTDSAYNEGETAFLRGVSFGAISRQFDAMVANPNAGRDGSDADIEKWNAQQEARISAANGLLLGYLNGVVQAIRRIDNQLMHEPMPSPTESR